MPINRPRYLIAYLYSAQVLACAGCLLLLLVAFASTQPFRAGLVRALVTWPLSLKGMARWCAGCLCYGGYRYGGHGGYGGGMSQEHRHKGHHGRHVERTGAFNAAVYAALIYLIACAGVRGWQLALVWDCNSTGNAAGCDPWSSTAFRVVYLLFRLGIADLSYVSLYIDISSHIHSPYCVSSLVDSVLYYYCFKRAIFGICDPRWYRLDGSVSGVSGGGAMVYRVFMRVCRVMR